MSKEVKLTDATILDCLNANELGDGMLYAALHYGRFVYNYSSSEWLAWRGHYWALDEMNEALASVEKVVNCYGAALDTLSSEKDGISDDLRKCFVKRLRKLRSEHGRQNTLKFAQTNSQNALAVLGEQLDRDPWLLACSNGTVNLATGEMHPGRPDDFLTKASPVEWDDIEAPCPIWEKTLSEIFGGDMDLIHYVQRFFGYALTGLSNENVLPILWGQGRNGKTTIIETISKIMGPLAAPIQAEMLLDQGRSRSSAGPSPDIMSLKGLRLAFGSEADENRKFSTSRIKWLSGSDTLIGRAPHDRRETSFQPSHTLILLTNHRPHASASDFAFWERIHLIPFNFSFVDRAPQDDNEFRADKDLPIKLEAEGPGILAWLVRGCLKWMQIGLAPPETVKSATQEYRRDEDLLADFLQDCCFIDPTARARFKDLYERFQEWHQEFISKKYIPSGKKFGQLLRAAKFKEGHSNGRYYEGLRLLGL